MNTYLQKTSRTLDEKDAILNTMIDNFDGYVWSIDRSYRSLYRNSRLRNILQKLYGDAAKEDKKVFSFLEAVDPQLARKWEQLYKAAFDGEAQQVIHEFEHAGEPVILELSINPVYEDTEVTSLACFARDITAEKIKERQHQAAETRFRALIEKSHDGICLADTEGKILYVSDSVKRILGYNPSELYGRKSIDFLHNEDCARMIATLKELKPFPGKSVEVIYRVKHKNGEWRWICSHVTNMLTEPFIEAFVLNYNDQTERLLAEQAIHNSEALYRSLFNNSPMPIWVCDRKNLAYLEVNNTAIKSYGYSREEFLSMTAFDLRAPDNRHDLQRITREGKCDGFRNKLRRHIKKNGEIAFTELAVHPIIFNKIPAYLVLANDISETLQLQHTLMEERLTKQIDITKATIDAQETERNEVGKELHDNVNQMLATVKLYLSSYYKGVERDDEMLTKSLDIIDDSIAEIRTLCKSLVPPSLGEISLKESLEALILPIKLANKNVRLCVNEIQEETLSSGLKISIYRIVQEQLNNIIKHSEATNVIISLQRNERKLKLTIADNGLGFDILKKRAGIGLTNIQNRSSTFNGKVDIESSPGQGCRLQVNFCLE